MTDPTRPLEGKRALITGGGRGIGADLARAYAAAGAALVISGRNQAALDDYAGRLTAEFGVAVTGIAADLADPAATELLAERALAAYGGLDVLINNAGISYPERIIDLDAGHLDEVLAVNLRSPALLAARVGAAMAAAGGGSIINLASTAGVRALDEHYVYCMTKAALIMATKMLALELGPSGVRSNALCPTVTLTDMGQRVWLDNPEKARPMLARIPLGRFIDPAEVSAVAVWLASDAAAVINGTEIPIDGGLLVT